MDRRLSSAPLRGVSRRGVILRSINRTDCPLAKDARPALKAAMHDSDPDVRRKALEALNKIDPAQFKSAE